MENKKEKKNIFLLISSSGITQIGNIIFDSSNNLFLSHLNYYSPHLLGYYQGIDSIIGIIFNIFGGVIADIYKKKLIVFYTTLFSGLICCILPLLPFKSTFPFILIISNALLALFSSFYNPSYRAIVKDIVKKNSISKLNSLLKISGTIIKIIIPVISIFIYKTVGIRIVMLLNGISFIISAFIFLYITPLNTESIRESNNTLDLKKIYKELFEGMNYIFKKKKVFYLILISSSVNFFLAGYNLILPYSDMIFKLDHNNSLYGVFLTAEAIGGLIGASLNSFTKGNSLKKMLGSLFFSGICICIIVPVSIVTRSILVISFFPLIFNLLLTIYNIEFLTLIQSIVDEVFIGRVFGVVFSFVVLFMPIGTGFFSLVVSPKSILNFVIIGICISFIAVLGAFLFLKKS